MPRAEGAVAVCRQASIERILADGSRRTTIIIAHRLSTVPAPHCRDEDVVRDSARSRAKRRQSAALHNTAPPGCQRSCSGPKLAAKKHQTRVATGRRRPPAGPRAGRRRVWFSMQISRIELECALTPARICLFRGQRNARPVARRAWSCAAILAE